jgi:hypothetical protein
MITCFDTQPPIGFLAQINVGNGQKFEYGSARHPNQEVIRSVFFRLTKIFNIAQEEVVKKFSEKKCFLNINESGNFLELGNDLYVQFIATDDQESFGINYYILYRNFDEYKGVFKSIKSMVPLNGGAINQVEFFPLEIEEAIAMFDLFSRWISTPKNDPQGWPPLN